ncbi:restriction endonuclease subunit S [Clostridium nigeriense]|uniref:restriction endonuclease subunit S n=1 Tax=Clostridium nigeriense TaxID=1805470 RepID=UPI003D354AE4
MRREKLGDIARFSQGVQVAIDKQYSSVNNNSVRFLRIIDYTQNKDEIRYIDNPGEKYLVNDRDVVMIRYGDAGRVVRGYVGAIANNLFKITVDENLIINEYLYYYLSQKIVYNRLINNQQKTGLPAVNFKTVNEIICIFPEDIEIQKKIVNILDKAQELINKRKEQIEALDELVKSKFIEMFGDPVSNPMNWEKKKLADECNIITGNTPSRKVEEYYGDYIEWIKSDNITDAGVYLTTAREYLSEEGLKVGRSIEKNSILMTCIAGSIKCIGNVAIANRRVTFNQQINGIEPLKNNVFFMLQQFNLSQKYIQSTINMSLKGILSKGQLSELEFIFPPIDKQNEFAEFFKQVDKLKFELEKSLKELEDNFNSLMQRAFKGELF